MTEKCYPATIEVDGQTYVKQADATPTERRIVIGQSRHIFVGDYAEEGELVVLTNASMIRYWGTTKGLGQLADTGPTSKTILDPCGTVRIHRLAVVAMLDVRNDKL